MTDIFRFNRGKITAVAKGGALPRLGGIAIPIEDNDLTTKAWVKEEIQTGDFVPISGTESGVPITGIIESSSSIKIDTIDEYVSAAGVTIDGLKIKDSEPYCDVVNEKSSATGVTIDGVLLKDSEVTTNVINEKTGAAGVTADGVLLKDSQVTTDTINEKTSAAGVTADSVLLKDGAVINSKNVGVAGTNVTAVEYGDGYHHITILTLAAVVLGAPTAGGNSAHGSLIYTFPTSAVHLHSHTYFSVGLTTSGVTTDAPDVGIGSVIGSGSIATLNGTTMEDYVTGITWGTTLDGTEEVQDTIAATAGIFAGISNNATGDIKLVHFNAADGWNASVTGNLLADGTVVLIWDSLT